MSASSRNNVSEQATNMSASSQTVRQCHAACLARRNPANPAISYHNCVAPQDNPGRRRGPSSALASSTALSSPPPPHPPILSLLLLPTPVPFHRSILSPSLPITLSLPTFSHHSPCLPTPLPLPLSPLHSPSPRHPRLALALLSPPPARLQGEEVVAGEG